MNSRTIKQIKIKNQIFQSEFQWGVLEESKDNEENEQIEGCAAIWHFNSPITDFDRAKKSESLTATGSQISTPPLADKLLHANP